MILNRRTFCVLAAAAAASSALGLTGCAGEDENSSASVESVEFLAMPEDRELMGSADPCDVRVGLIMGPPAMGLTQFLLAAENGQTENNFGFTFWDVDYVGLSAAFNNGDYDIATLPSNIGPILYNNEELKNEYRIISINNLGVLYVITGDASVKTMEDLKGRNVYSYGEAGTPEYTIEALLEKTGNNGLFNLEFKSSPLEVLNLLIEDPECVAILPQPFVSLGKILTSPLYTPIDLTVEWDEAFAETGSQMVTTTTIVNKAFLEEHEQAVVEYLNMAGQSAVWTLENIEAASSLQEELGTFLNNAVALDAMSQIALVNLVGVEMRTAISGFLEELYIANPDSVGGTLPPDEFYYLPPTGAVSNWSEIAPEGAAGVYDLDEEGNIVNVAETSVRSDIDTEA